LDQISWVFWGFQTWRYFDKGANRIARLVLQLFSNLSWGLGGQESDWCSKSGGTCSTAFLPKARVHVRGARWPRHHCASSWGLAPMSYWLVIHVFFCHFNLFRWASDGYDLVLTVCVSLVIARKICKLKLYLNIDSSGQIWLTSILC
jgi:hypothetical protein